MTKTLVRVLCVDDHAFLGEGLATRLGLESDLEFVGWRSSAEALPREIKETSADVVLLDIEMPGPDPFEVLGDVSRLLPDIRVIMLSAYVRDHFLNQALQAGAWGYLSKSDDPSTVIDAIRTVMRGEFAFGPEVLKRCRPMPGGGRHSPTTGIDRLTPREFQILRMIGKGMTRLEIASAIHRSPKTIDNHRAAIMEKLSIHDRVELARYAIQEGLTGDIEAKEPES